MLRRAKMSPQDIVNIYCSKVRPVVEYAAPVWHPGLTQDLRDSIEDIQIRALKIAVPTLTYEEALSVTGIPSLNCRRIQLCKLFFEKIQSPNDKLFRMLPPKKDNPRNTRSGGKFPLPKTSTKRFKDSFLPYAFYNLQ